MVVISEFGKEIFPDPETKVQVPTPADAVFAAIVAVVPHTV